MDRDQALDVWKGLGCLLMIVAHTNVAPNDWVLLGRFIGEMAPLVFFPIAGVTAYLQAQRRTLPELTIYYGLIALLGMSVAGLVNQGMSSHPFYFDIVSLIGVSSIAVVACVRAGVPQWGLFGIGLAIALVSVYAPQPQWGLALFSPNDGEGLFFSLFPWAGVVFCGAGLYGCRRGHALVLTLACFAVMALVPGLGLGDVLERRVVSIQWGLLALEFAKAPTMSLDYFAFSLLLTLVIFRWRPRLAVWPWAQWLGAWFARLGGNSLLFFYLHMLLVILAAPFAIDHPVLKWLVLFGVSAILTNSYAKFGQNRWAQRLFGTPWPWLVMSGAMVATVTMSRGWDWMTCVAVGFLFATQISTFRQMLRTFFDAAQARNVTVSTR